MVALKHISKKDAAAIGAYETLLLNKFHGRIKNILLFGSKARGDAGRHSDIDILVVINQKNKKTRREIASLTHQPITQFEVLLSPVIVKEDFFKKWSPLREHINKEGILLWGAEPK